MNSAQFIANRFEIHDLLGHGGMGKVYRAIDAQTGETVVVKALIGLAHTDKSGKVA
jgi:serine/threonine protein kinase